MESHAPKRLHHSRSPSLDLRPTIPIKMTIVRENAFSTNAGIQTNASSSPSSHFGTHCWSSRTMAHNRKCNVAVAGKGATKAQNMLAGSNFCSEQKESNMSDVNTTVRGKGQYRHACL